MEYLYNLLLTTAGSLAVVAFIYVIVRFIIFNVGKYYEVHPNTVKITNALAVLAIIVLIGLGAMSPSITYKNKIPQSTQYQAPIEKKTLEIKDMTLQTKKTDEEREKDFKNKVDYRSRYKSDE